MDKGYTGEVTIKIIIENGRIKIINLDNNTQTINYDVKDYDDTVETKITGERNNFTYLEG